MAYQPLPSNESISHDDIPDSTPEVQIRPISSRCRNYLSSTRFSWHVIYVAIAITLLGIAVNVVSLKLQYVPLHSRGLQQRPEFVSAYIGLDTTTRQLSWPLPPDATNFPVAFGIINASAPHIVRPKAPERAVTRIGISYPEDRQVILFKEGTTLVRFWAGDFGMERCMLKLSLPAFDDRARAAELIVEPSNSSVHIKAYHVHEPLGAGLRHFSSTTRPKRGDLFMSWEVHDGQSSAESSQEFACPSGTYWTFELACVATKGEDCLVNFWQAPHKHDLGIWLVQKASL